LFAEQVLGAELRPDITPDIPVVFRRLMSACWNSDATRRPSFTVIGKILNKSAEELGSYGTEGAAQMSFQPKGEICFVVVWFFVSTCFVFCSSWSCCCQSAAWRRFGCSAQHGTRGDLFVFFLFFFFSFFFFF
jgi:hypothetical protein